MAMILRALTVLLALLVTGCRQPASESSDVSHQAAEQQVLAVEDEYVAAEINRDEAALRRLVDDRFVFNSADGTTSGKDALIQSVLGMNMTGQTISERSVLVAGDLAVTFGTAEIRHRPQGGDERTTVLRYTTVYTKRQGDWRMIALQMTPRSARGQ